MAWDFFLLGVDSHSGIPPLCPGLRATQYTCNPVEKTTTGRWAGRAGAVLGAVCGDSPVVVTLGVGSRADAVVTVLPEAGWQ